MAAADPAKAASRAVSAPSDQDIDHGRAREARVVSGASASCASLRRHLTTSGRCGFVRRNAPLVRVPPAGTWRVGGQPSGARRGGTRRRKAPSIATSRRSVGDHARRGLCRSESDAAQGGVGRLGRRPQRRVRLTCRTRRAPTAEPAARFPAAPQAAARLPIGRRPRRPDFGGRGQAISSRRSLVDGSSLEPGAGRETTSRCRQATCRRSSKRGTAASRLARADQRPGASGSNEGERDE